MRALALPTGCLVVVDDPAPRAPAQPVELARLRDGDTVRYARLALPDLFRAPSTPSVVAPPATEVP